MTCENWFKSYKDLYGLDYVILRYFNVFGPRQLGGSPYAGVIANWVHAIYYNKPLVIYGDGNQTRDFVYVSDVARANIAALDCYDGGFRTFNICSGIKTSLNDITGYLKDELDKSFEVIYEEARKEVRDSVGSNTRGAIGLEWEPALTFREGLEKTLDWRGVS